MSLIGSTNEEKIWNYLKAKGLPDCGIASLMGNLYAESCLIPTNLQNSYEKALSFTDAAYTAAVDNGTYQNFVKDSAGYGLAQWTYWSRKKNLLDFAKKKGKSIGDLEMQLDFLWNELQGYTVVISTLKTAKTVRAASDSVLLNFERPADQSEAAKTRRAGFGQKFYDIVAAAAEQIAGAGLILWTCREGELLENALEACARWGLHFDAVNDSLPSWKKFYGNDTRKVGATEYWDDKAYRVQNGKLMKEVAHEMD